MAPSKNFRAWYAKNFLVMSSQRFTLPRNTFVSDLLEKACKELALGKDPATVRYIQKALPPPVPRPLSPIPEEDDIPEWTDPALDEQDFAYFWDNGCLPLGSTLKLPSWEPIPQGNSVTNIYGDGNHVSTSQGSGWQPNVAVGRRSASAPPQTPNPLLQPSPSKLAPSSTPTDNDNLTTATFSYTQSGNAFVALSSNTPVFEPMAFPPEPDLSYLPEPTVPGPDVVRYWLVSEMPWTTSNNPGDLLAKDNAITRNPSFPPLADVNFRDPYHYNYPFSLLRAHPETPIAAGFFANAFYRSGVDVLMTVTTPPSVSGTLALIAVPENDPPRLPLSGVFMYPYAILNLTSTSSVRLRLPHLSPMPVDPTMSHGGWNFRVVVLSALNVPSGANNSYTVTLQMSPVNLRFWCPRDTQRLGMPYPQVLVNHQTPTTGPGFVVPSMPDAVALVPYRTPEPDLSYLPDPISDYVEMAARPGYYSSYDWSSEATSGTRLVCQRFDAYFLRGSLTPLSQALSHFSQYTGNLWVDLLFVGSQFSAGRLVVTFTPPTTGCPGTLPVAIRSTHAVWDVSTSDRISFPIPYYSPTPWRTLPLATGLTGIQWPNTASMQLSTLMGWLGIYVQQPLRAPPSAVSDAKILLFVSAGPSFRMRYPSALGLLTRQEGGDDASSDQLPEPTAPPQSDSGIASFFSPPQLLAWGSRTSGVPLSVSVPGPAPAGGYNNHRRWYQPLTVNSFLAAEPYGIAQTTQNQILGGGTTFPAPSYASFASLLMSEFAYFRADLDVAIVVSNLPQNVPAQLIVSFIPPGDNTTSNPWYAPTYSPISFTVPSTGAQNSSVFRFSVPYASVNPVIASSFSGWPFAEATATYGAHPFDMGCIIVDWYTMVHQTDGQLPAADFTPSFSFAFGFKNLRTFVPRLISHASEPGSSLGTWFIPPFSVMPPLTVGQTSIPNVAYPEPTSREEPDSVATLSYTPSPLRQAGDHLVVYDEPTYIIRAWRMTYAHWAIRQGDRQISLSQQGLNAVVSYEPIEGEIYAPTLPAHFAMAEAMIGSVYPYSLTSNCADFISLLTGTDLHPDTGRSLAWGLCLTGAAAAAGLVAQTAETKPVKQGLGDSASKALEASRTFKESTQNLARLAESPAVARNLRVAAETTANLKDANLDQAAESLRRAAEKISDSVEGASAFLDKLTPLMESAAGVGSSLVSTFLSWLLKFVGLLLIIFGSPTPMSLAGAVAFLSADLIPSIARALTSAKSPLATPLAWLASRFGLNPSAEECDQQASDMMRAVDDHFPAPNPAPTRQANEGVKSYNDVMNAMKNTDWLIGKILFVVKQVLDWLGLLSKKDPRGQIAQHHEECLELYSDSINASSSASIDPVAMETNLSRAKDLLEVASKSQSPTHSQLLTRTVANYESRRSRHEAARAPPRQEPYVVYLYGPPGTGKSVLAGLLASTLAAALVGDPDAVYAPTAADCKFYDGYYGQPVHFIDDIGQDPAGDDWKDIPNLVSSAPFILPMADLTEKGRLYTSKVIIMTSNFSGPNDRATRCVGALERRLKLKIEILPRGFDGAPRRSDFDPQVALLPDGPATRFFAADCPLTRLESFTFRVASGADVKFDHLDDLVGYILSRVESNKASSLMYRHLIRKPQKQNGSLITPEEYEIPAGAVRYSEGRVTFSPSVPTELSKAIDENKPVSVIQRLWNYRKPLFVTATFLSLLASLGTLFYLLYSYFKTPRNQPQGPYNGNPIMQPPRTSPRPPAGPRPLRQSLHPALPQIAKNLVVVSCGDCSVNGLFVYGRYLATVTHIFTEPTVTVTTDYGEFEGHKVLELGEICLVHVPQAREYKDLRRFIRNPREFPTANLISQTSSGPLYLLATSVRRGDTPYPDVTGMTEIYTYSTPSFPGLCGAPLITLSPAGPSIVGMHEAGVAGVSGIAIPLLPLIEAPFPQSLIATLPPPPEPHHVPRRSRLRHSPAWGAFEPTKEPAPLSDFDPRMKENGVSVNAVAFSKQGKGDLVDPWPTLEPAFDFYFSHHDFPRCRMLTLDEAINGTPLLDGIDMSQSPGYPWSNHTKRRDLFDVGEDGLYHAKPELVSAVERIIANPDYYYATVLKDELRPSAKARAGKTRLVEGAPIDAILAGRMLLGGVLETFHQHPGDFGSAVGCDPDVSWTPIFHSFSRFPEVFDLDYSCYDSTIPSCAFTLLAKKLEEYIDYSPGVPNGAVTNYIQSISRSKHVFGDFSYEMIGGNPSGCVGTSIINSICNNCFVISALMAHKHFTPGNFKILAYGDDVIYATNPVIHPSFIKDFYDQNTPLIVTPASKDGTFPDHSTIWDVTFLKRHFVPDETFPAYIHPVIDPETYQQSVMWMRDGEFQQLVDSLSYLAHHAGPTNYKTWCDAVKSVCEPRGVKVTFLPYSYLQNRWLQSVVS